MKQFSTFVCVCFASVVLVSCSAKPSAVSGATVWEAPGQQDALAVEALTVTTGLLVNVVSASGAVSGVNEALVLSEAQGIIRTVSFSIGDRVRSGQELVKVDDAIAASNLQRAKDQLDAASLELRANEQIIESGGGTPAALTRSRSAESAARAQYDTALKAYRDTTIRSPISGVIASREDVVTTGNLLSPFARVARIVDNSSFKITVGVGEREIGLVSPGAVARVSVPAALGADTVDATVLAVGAGADPATGSYPVVVSFANRWDSLVKSGMSASVEIEVKKTKPSVIIPRQAIVSRGGKSAVFIVRDGAARVREVSIGRVSGVRAEILSGLAAGDILVISALSRLSDGTPVNPAVRGESATRE
jgi:membrane fusion protein (multidrug efflux system)